MKYLWATLAVVVLLAAAAGFTGYRLSCEPMLHTAAAKGDAMEWLRADFHLTDAQFAAIREVHNSYAGFCAEHCRMIQEATKARNALQAAGRADPAAMLVAEQKIQELRAHCETAITRHVRQVAALMSPEDGQRYLALVLPKIADFDHQAVPDLHLNHSS
jgi:hypothetical protein